MNRRPTWCSLLDDGARVIRMSVLLIHCVLALSFGVKRDASIVTIENYR